MVDYSLHKHFYQSYIVDEDLLRHIDHLLCDVSPKRRWDISLSDNGSISFSSLEELLKFPNVSERSITNIEIRAYSLDKSITISFDKGFMTDLPVTKIYLHSNDERDIDYYLKRCTQLINDSRRGKVYSFFAQLNLFGLVSTGLFVLSWYGMISSPMSPGEQFRTFINGIFSEKAVFIVAILVVYVFVLLVITRILDTIQRILFPSCTFAIGAGVKRERISDNLRNTVLVGGIALPFIWFVITSLLTG
ncbi:MAG: hypothetical protein J0M33_19965 [Anaerolineae bacterium]|nr:hypothetical protein [Anaerolineae bacterium]